MSSGHAEGSEATQRTVVIVPGSRVRFVDWRSLWEYRELLFALASRDIRVRYKQTLIGAAWAIVQPTFQMVLFTVVFGRLAGMPSDGAPYAVFSYTGLIAWAYFAGVFSRVSGSVVGASLMITRVYFPRLVIPLATTLTPLLDFTIAGSVLVGLMFYFGIVPGWPLLAIPVFLGLAWMAALGAGLWMAALNVHYRDVAQVMPFVMQVWMFATPIVYPTSLFPDWARPWIGLNPMVGVVEGFRWALLTGHPAPGPELGVSTAVAAFLLVSGLLFFQRMERTFADVV